jgi:hypothetical protein
MSETEGVGMPPGTLTASQLSPMVAGNSQFQNSIDKANLEPGTYTLQFGVLDIQKHGSFFFSPIVQAIVTWKIGGQQQRRVISVTSGASLTGVAEGVDVKLVDLTTNPVGYNYKVQVTLSKGTRGNVQQPPVLYALEGQQQLSNSGLIVFSVPQDAGVISVFPFIFYDRNNPADIFMQYTDLGFLTNYADVDLIPPGHWYPLVPGTGRVEFLSNAAAGGPVTFISVLWGIDG